MLRTRAHWSVIRYTWVTTKHYRAHQKNRHTQWQPVVCAGTAASQQWLDRQNSNAAAGPSHKSSSRPLGRQRTSINYSLLAGNRKPELKASASMQKPPAKKAAHKHSPAPQADLRKDQAALAVAAAIAAGQQSLLRSAAGSICYTLLMVHYALGAQSNTAKPGIDFTLAWH